MRAIPLFAAAVAFAPLGACATAYDDPYRDGYYERQYRAGSYEAYPMSHDDYVYRGSDGRYYCRRRDGTIGLVVGAGVGAVLGNLVAPRGSRTLGTLIGAAGGGAIGYAIERGEMQCQ